MTETDLAYLAGLIDGEGTISASISLNTSGYVAVNKFLSIFNTNYKLMLWIQSRFGGKIYSRDRADLWKTEHQIKWSPEEASEILKWVLPYLVIKSEQAELLILIHSYKGHRDTFDEQAEIVKRIQELNKRGRPDDTGRTPQT